MIYGYFGGPAGLDRGGAAWRPPKRALVLAAGLANVMVPTGPTLVGIAGIGPVHVLPANQAERPKCLAGALLLEALPSNPSLYRIVVGMLAPPTIGQRTSVLISGISQAALGKAGPKGLCGHLLLEDLRRFERKSLEDVAQAQHASGILQPHQSKSVYIINIYTYTYIYIERERVCIYTGNLHNWIWNLQLLAYWLWGFAGSLAPLPSRRGSF